VARINVEHNIGALAADCRTIAVTTQPRAAKIVKANVKEAEKVMRGFARASAGPHGKNYFKRVTSTMTTPLSGEVGPTGDVSKSVGGGWRNGPPNTDMPKTADIMGPKFASAIAAMADDLFWPGA
jgi:hypothetical protein